MKKFISILLTILLTVSLVGCKKNPSSQNSTTSEVWVEVWEDEEGNGAEGDNANDNSNANSNTVSGGSTGADNVSAIDTAGITTVDGLDFGGRTIKMAITNDKTPTDSEKRMFAAFEKTYNCKLKYDVINFDGYLKTISNKIATNDPYDIVYIHGSMFPNAAISRLLSPLDSAIYDKDKLDKNNISAGGIDMEKSAYYKWGNKQYAVSGYNDVNIYFMYYNKQKFSSGNLPDPLELYNAGQWTWDKVVEIGKKVTNIDKGVYFGDASFVEKAIVESYGGHYIKKTSDTNVTENFSDSKIFNGLKMVARISNGAEQIIQRGVANGSDPSEFVSGRTYAFISEDLRYTVGIAPAVLDDKKLNGKLDTIGIVPLPLGNGNTEYPAGWIQGIGACRGCKDITPAVAFLKFRSTWKDTEEDPYQLPQYAQELRTKFLSNINYVDYGYSSGSDNISSIVHLVESSVASGQDIQKTIDTYKNSAQNCINISLKKQ